MGINNFLRAVSNTLKLAHKSDREEFILYLKLVALGVGVVGAIGYIIQSVGALFQLGR